MIGVPRVIAFKVVGIFFCWFRSRSKLRSHEPRFILEAYKAKNGIGLELKVKNVLEARNIGRAIMQKLDTTNYIKMTSWDQSYGGLFRAVQLEKNNGRFTNVINPFRCYFKPSNVCQ